MKTLVGDFGITFAVAEVAPATDRLPTSKTNLALYGLLGEGKEIDACSGYNTDCIENVRFHPLLAATHIAFSQHRALCLSPDIIWVTIVQGLARHIRNNSELLRKHFVSHEGKQTIAVARQDLLKGTPENAWESVISEMSAGVQNVVGARYSQLISDFSTTGTVERTACEVALLDAFQPYFQYEVYCICGIPSITLEGRPADWQRLRDKIEYLQDYDLDWWLPSLRGIADEFVKASQGEINLGHWTNIYKRHDAYGYDNVNGWLVKLIPYLENKTSGNVSYRNPLLECGDSTEARLPDGIDEPSPFVSPVNVISTSTLPTGVSQAPFKMQWMGEAEPIRMDFLGGFLGVTQDPSTGALRPQLGWAVRQSPELEQLYSQLDKFNPAPPLEAGLFDKCIRTLLDREDRSFSAGVPGDFISFYKYCNGLSMLDGKFVFMPLEEVTDTEKANATYQDSMTSTKKKWFFSPSKSSPVFSIPFCKISDGNVVLVDLESTPNKIGAYGYRVHEFNTKTNERRQIAESFKEFVEMCLGV